MAGGVINNMNKTYHLPLLKTAQMVQPPQYSGCVSFGTQPYHFPPWRGQVFIQPTNHFLWKLTIIVTNRWWSYKLHYTNNMHLFRNNNPPDDNYFNDIYKNDSKSVEGW